MLDVRPLTKTLANFVGLICSAFFIGIVIWVITAFIDWEITGSMWKTLIILVIGYGNTQVLYHYIKRTLE